MDFNAEITRQTQDESPIYRPFDNGFEKASIILGVISIVTAIMGLATIPMMLGGVAIILALLSRGKGSMSTKAIRGMTCGIVGVAVNIFLMAYIVFLFCTNVQYRNAINDTCKAMYNYTFNEVIEEAVGGDFDLEEYLTR